MSRDKGNSEPIQRIAQELRRGPVDGVSYNISLRADFEELRQLSPEQLDAFMAGVAEVLSANPYREPEAK